MRPRHDPWRAPVVTGRGGRPRIDRASGGEGELVRPAEPIAAAEAPVVRIESPDFDVFVVPDALDGRLRPADRHALALARALADREHAPARGRVVAITFGVDAVDWGREGADRVLRAPACPDDAHAPEARIAPVLQAYATARPRHVVVPESADIGSEFGRRLAQRLGVRPDAHVRHWSPRALVRATGHPAQEWVGAPGHVVLVDGPAAPPIATRHAGETRPLDAPASSGHVRVLEPPPWDATTLPLAEAEFVLSAGDGLRDVAAFRALARRLNATLGASRVVVDAGRLPRDRQVGASGHSLSARCYLAFGISGAAQHLQGVERCEHVLAVNTDAGCAMVRRAELAVITDANALVHALLAQLPDEASDGP